MEQAKAVKCTNSVELSMSPIINDFENMKFKNPGKKLFLETKYQNLRFYDLHFLNGLMNILMIFK